MKEQNQSEFTYYAFISYKHDDEKWAKWLQKKIESYGFPVGLRKDNSKLPSKIRPIFRDQSDLSGGNLKEEIENGLKSSRFLIVICSPRSAQSPWVSKEVQYFKDNDREDNIIPFIIGGSPNAKNPEEECFPEGLRQLSGEKEILGININEMGRDAAAIKVIARMFDLRFDTLWQRHERAKRRKRFAIIAGVVVFAVISLAVAWNMHNLKLQADTNAERANKERVRANEQTEIALKANKSLELAYDSIKRQSIIITQANKNLEQANKNLAEERDNVLKANWRMMENRARAVAEKANQLIDEKNSYLARLLCLEVLPKNLKKPEIPYVPEVERAFRRSWNNYTGKIYTDHMIYGMTLYGDKIAISGSEGLSIYDANTLTLETIIREDISIRDYNSSIKQFISCGDSVKIWDASSFTCIKKFANKKKFRTCKFNSDGSMFCLGKSGFNDRENGFEIYNSQSMECIKSFNGKKLSMRGCSFSPDNRYLAFYNSDGISLLDTKTYHIVQHFQVYNTNLISFNSDGNYLVSSHTDETKIWDMNSFKCVKTLQENNKSLINTAIMVRNYIITGGSDSKIRIWDFDKGICIDSLAGHSSGITSLFYDTHKYGLISTSYDGSLICHGHMFGYIKDLQLTLFGSHDNMVYSMSLSPNGKYLASGSYDKIIKIWDTTSWHCIATLKGHTSSIESLSFSQDSKYLASGSNKIIIWDTSGWDSIKTLGTDSSYNHYKGLAYHPNGKVLYTVKKNLLQEWDLQTSKQTKCQEIPQHVNSLALSPDGQTIITGGRGTIYQWNTDSLNCIYRHIAPRDAIYTITFSPDGTRYLTGSSDGTCILWDINGKCLKTFENQIRAIYSSAFSPDGKYIATGTVNGWIKIWEVESGVCVYSLKTGHEARALIFGTDREIDGDYQYLYYYAGKGEIGVILFHNLHTLMHNTNLYFKDRPLTPEERREYYLE